MARKKSTENSNFSLNFSFSFSSFQFCSNHDRKECERKKKLKQFDVLKKIFITTRVVSTSIVNGDFKRIIKYKTRGRYHNKQFFVRFFSAVESFMNAFKPNGNGKMWPNQTKLPNVQVNALQKLFFSRFVFCLCIFICIKFVTIATIYLCIHNDECKISARNGSKWKKKKQSQWPRNSSA